MTPVNSESRPAGGPVTVRTVAFLGTGLMGRGMAQSLARAGHRLRVWNRTRAKAVEAAPPGATVVDTPAEAVQGADVAVTMLADPAAVRAVVDGPGGLISEIRAGATLIDSSTVDPATSREIAARLSTKGAFFLDAPVYGSKNEAAQGQLGFLVGGPPDVFAGVEDLFVGCMARAVHYLGDTGAGSTTKLVVNAVIAMTLEAAQEGLVLAAKAGLDPRRVYDVLMASRTRSGILEMKGPGTLAHDFTPFFALRLMDKDLKLALDAAHGLKVPLPTLAAVKQIFSACMAAGQGDTDFSSIVQHLERGAGTSLVRSSEK